MSDSETRGQVRKPRVWLGPCGKVWCDIEEDGARTVHVAIPHAILTGQCCRRLTAWLIKAAEWVEDTKEGGR